MNDLHVLALDGDRAATPYLVTEFSEAEGAFSPDGRWVAYQSQESGDSEIFVRPFPPGGGKWQISVERRDPSALARRRQGALLP